jgi:hypothetical protein
MLLQAFCPVGQHKPSVHCSIDPQTVPHIPQLSMSVFVSTHAPPHAVFPIGHTTAHDPLTHDHVPPPMIVPASAPPHVLPHFPQFALSDFTSTHALPHFVAPLGHWQLPCTHVAVAGQLVPHLPQLAGSVLVSTQTLLQNVEHDAESVGVVPPSKSSNGWVVVAQPMSTQSIAKKKARMVRL